MSDRRRCLLVGDPDKGGFTVHTTIISKRKVTKQFPLCRLIAKLPWKYWIGYQYRRISACKYRTIGILVKTHISATLIYCTCNQQQLFCGELFSVLLTSQWHKIICKILPGFYCDFPPKLQNKTRKPRLETTTVLQQLTHLGHCADPFALSNAAGEDVCRDISFSLIS